MSYLRYFCLFVYSGVQHILRCVFVLFFIFVLCTLHCMLPVSLGCPYLVVPLECSNVYINDRSFSVCKNGLDK